METLDWKNLDSSISKDTSKVSYQKNKHLFTKVAFDVFRLNNSPVESLWILEGDENGEQYLVARYDDEESEGIEAQGSWSAISDKDGKNVTLIYKDRPIKRFASSEYGFTSEDVHIFQRTLIEKLSSDKKFVEKLLNLQPEEKKRLILSQFPELA